VYGNESDFYYNTLRVRGVAMISDPFPNGGSGLHVAQRLEVMANGTLSVGADLDSVAIRADTADIVIQGDEAMFQMDGSLLRIVVDSIHFASGDTFSSLNGGELHVLGAFVQRTWSLNEFSVYAEPDHKTVIDGKAVVDFENPVFNYLGALRVTGGDTLTLNSDLRVASFARNQALDGRVVIRAAAMGSGNARTVTTTNGFSVLSSDSIVVFRNVALNVTADAGLGDDLAINRLTWSSDMDPAVTALTLRADNYSSPTFSNLTFNYTVDGGKYFFLDGSGTITFTNSTPFVGCFELGCSSGDSAPFPVELATWTGLSSTNWTDLGNWDIPRLPDAYTDVLIPDGASNYPLLTFNEQRQVRNLTTQANATIHLGQFANLTVRGDFNNAGDVNGDSGAISMGPAASSSLTASGFINSQLNIVGGIGGAVGTVYAQSSVNVFNLMFVSARLDLNDQSFYVDSNFTVHTATGLLIMDDPNSTLTIRHNANFQGANSTGYLTEGLLDISGDFTQSGTHQFAFAPSGNHTTAFNGNEFNSVVSFNNPGPGNSRFNRLSFEKDSVWGVTFTKKAYINNVIFWNNDISVTNDTVTVLNSFSNPSLGGYAINLSIGGFVVLADVSYLTDCGPLGAGAITVNGSQSNFSPAVCVNITEQLVSGEQQGHQNQEERAWESLRQYVFRD
jgi:hypothetical protein